MKTRISLLGAGCLLLAAWPSQAQSFTASLTPGQDGGGARTGSGTVALTLSGATLSLSGSFSGLSANSSAAHIHGPSGPFPATAGVLYNLAGLATLGGTAGSFAGSVTLAPIGGYTVAQQIADLNANQWYINVHSGAFPGGEIRGQITLNAPAYPRPTYSSPIALSLNDRLIFAVNPSDDSVAVIRPDNNTRITNIPVGDEPESIALTPNGQYAYVANAAGNSVSVIQINDPAWGTFSANVVATLITGAEPWNIVTSPDGNRVFVANSAQDTITVINAATRSILGHVDLRNSLANDPDRSRHFQPRGLAVTADNTKLYVTRFLSFTKPGGRQGDDLGKEGLVAVLNINTASANIADYNVARVLTLAPTVTGFKFPGLTNPPAPDTLAFPNQLQSIVLRGDRAYLPNIAASPSGPLRFNLDTHAYVNQIGGVNSATPTDLGALNLHLGARTPEAGKTKLFFANPWAIAFTTQSGAGQAYAVSAASDLLVKLNVDAAGALSFTASNTTTRYIDLNDPLNPATSAANAGKNPQGIAITSDGTRAYVANFVSRNVSVVDLTTDSVVAVVPTSNLPTPGSQGETNLVGAEVFFSSRGNFDAIPGTNSLRDRLSSEGWQSCASCHFKGLTDGVIWQFAAGPRKSVPLNSSFNPHNRNQQRLLNYSAIFDEIEDFELNIRNVSGPGNLATPINGNALNPNHGLLIGPGGDLNVAPTAVNAFALPNANRDQVTVTLPGSANKVPALTAMREWVRFAVRTPNAPLTGLPNGPSVPDLVAGRTLFTQAGCANCHGGQNWTLSLKDFNSPPPTSEINTERTGAFTGNPVGAQYLNRFLRDIGSFNLGVPGQGNPLGNDVGADEKAAAAVASGTLQPAQDALGIDYNSDTKGLGFNVPSLLGIHSVPPYLHNGAAESLAAVVADVKHRTANGRLPDRLANPADQARVVQFLESIDAATAPVLDVGHKPTYSSPIALNPTDRLIWVVNPSDNSVSVIRPDLNARLAKIGVGAEPESIALTPDNQWAYVANAAGNSVTIIRINDPAWGTFSAVVDSTLTTGAEPWNIVCSPDGRRVFVANSAQDTITVIDTATRAIIGHVDLRNSIANDPDRTRHFQPRGLAVTADNSKLYVTRFLSFTKPGNQTLPFGRQGDDFGKEGLVAVLDINTASANIADYRVARTIPLAAQITGFRFPGLTNDTAAFPNQLQSVVIRGETAYLPNIAASPSGPLRFNLDTHAFVNAVAGVNSTTPFDRGALNLHLGARDPEPGKVRLFFANPWAVAFTSQIGEGTGYAVSAASDLLVKFNIAADGRLSFTGDADTTRYIDLNDPDNPATRGANAGKNPQGIAITSDGTRAYVANFVSRNVSVVDLTTDTVIAVVPTSDLPAPGSQGETNLVGAEVFFSSRGNFDPIPGTNSLRNRLSSEGWQGCASCHFKGLTDGVIWQFAAGPRKSVPLNATFNPHKRTEQRLLNYSAIFDEVEDFEANIRNVSGPGALATPINGNALDPNHGLLIGPGGDLNVAPSGLNAFALPNANRDQVTVTLPGSANKVPALTAMREWTRFAVRTHNAPLPGLPNGASASEIAQGRALFLSAGCASCHGGLNWTVSVKDFTSPPAGSEIFTERTGTFTGNPVGAQYLNRFLRDIGSFNLGVPGQGNPLGNDVGADEKAAAAVVSGVLQPAQDALGIDYNADGRGIGFNVPSLLGLHAVPPFLHNGAAESLAAVVADVKHRTDNGRLPDTLSNSADRALVVAFLESIDVKTVPFVPLAARRSGNQLLVAFDSIVGGRYALEAKANLNSTWAAVGAPITGTGQRLEVPVAIDTSAKFVRLVAAP
jgi:YVTN family beta-propeller protein